MLFCAFQYYVIDRYINAISEKVFLYFSLQGKEIIVIFFYRSFLKLQTSINGLCCWVSRAVSSSKECKNGENDQERL